MAALADAQGVTESPHTLNYLSYLMNILAVDIGHGHVKIVHRPTSSVLRQEAFPSFAVPSPSNVVKKNSVTSGLNVMTVEVDGTYFRVGKDSAYTGTSIQRNRDENYSTTPAYHALMKGAFSIAAIEDIDLLVVGLPLSTLESNEQRLIDKLTGTHEVAPFTVPGSKEPRTKVTVRRVEVLAQPISALFSAVRKDPSLLQRRILTWDLGYHTLDLIMSHGLKPFIDRSGAVPGGVAKYIDEIQKSVEVEVRACNSQISGQYRAPAEIYEDALRSPSPRQVALNVGDINIEPHLQGANASLELDISKGIAAVGNLTDISAFIIAGGGASILHPILKKNYPEIFRMAVLDDSQFAVARGYFFFGEALAYQTK